MMKRTKRGRESGRGGWLLPWLAGGGVALAGPGAVVEGFAPDLRAEVAPRLLRVAADGAVLVGGGFRWIDGVETGDFVMLAADGSVSGEPLPGYLNRDSAFGLPIGGGGSGWQEGEWLPREDGGWLVPDGEGGWLRSDGEGGAQPAVSPAAAGARLLPQFEREGDWHFILRAADGGRTLVRENGAGGVAAVFSEEVSWPEEPLAAVEAAEGKLWVLTGMEGPWIHLSGHALPERRLIRVLPDGRPDPDFEALLLPGGRLPWLHPRADGGFTLRLGPDLTAMSMWPTTWPSSGSFRLRSHRGDGSLERSLDVVLPGSASLIWAENAEGGLLLADGQGNLRLHGADGAVVEEFASPARARASLRALPDGGWLVDGRTRIHADGGIDDSWVARRFERPAAARLLRPDGAGGMWVAGDFTSVNGEPRNGIARFTINGSLDPSFVPAPGVADPLSISATPDGLLVVLRRPLELDATRRSNLVKLRTDGSLDLDFFPRAVLPDGSEFPVSIVIGGSFGGGVEVADGFVSVHAGPDGALWAEAFHANTVPISTLVKLRVDGLQDPDALVFRNPAEPWLVLADGRLAIGGTIRDARGHPQRALGGGLPLRPLAEWRGGILFGERFDNGRLRPRLWRESTGWVNGFAHPPLAAANHRLPEALEGPGADLASGADGSLFLREFAVGSPPLLRRIGANGRVDENFAPAPAGSVLRGGEGPWRVASAAGLAGFDPASSAIERSPLAFAWSAPGQVLWVAGDFQEIGGRARGGLAWIDASGPVPAGPERDAYEAWALGFGLTEADPQADPDGDGIPNAIEFVLGGDPTRPTRGPELTNEDGRALFRHLRSAESAGWHVTVETSEDLAAWDEIGTREGAERSLAPGPGDSETIDWSLPPGEARRFLRLRATP